MLEPDTTVYEAEACDAVVAKSYMYDCEKEVGLFQYLLSQRNFPYAGPRNEATSHSALALRHQRTTFKSITTWTYEPTAVHRLLCLQISVLPTASMRV